MLAFCTSKFSQRFCILIATWTVVVCLQAMNQLSVSAQTVNEPSRSGLPEVPASQSTDLPWRPVGPNRAPNQSVSASAVQSPNQIPAGSQVGRIPAYVPNEPIIYPNAAQQFVQPTQQPVIRQVSGMLPLEDEETTPDSSAEPQVNNEITQVTNGIRELPNSAGQVWREYDITPYTNRITTSARPQQAVIDWVTMETGHDIWFNEPLGILSASKDKLRVYHTPRVQAQIKSIVDRFVYNQGRLEVVSLRLVTVTKPSWRQTAYSRMQPFDIQAPGVEGWMLSKENAAILLNELSRRSDFQQHSGGEVVLHDGQAFNISSKRPVSFVQSIRWLNGGIVPFEPVSTQMDEGFSLEFSGLNSIDGKVCEAIIKCDVNQVERLQTVAVNVPAADGSNQTVDLQIPQMVSWQVNERFRWPSDQVMLLSCGVVATPAQDANGLLGLNSLLNQSRGRADALLFVEHKGPAQRGATATAAGSAAGVQAQRR